MQRTANPCTPVRFRPQPPDKKMKVAIVGFGFVGKALFNAFDKSIEVLKIDPKLGTNLKDIEDKIISKKPNNKTKIVYRNSVL